MTPREVVKAAFGFERTGEVPYWLSMDEDVNRRLGEHYGTRGWREGRVQDFVWGGHFGFDTTPAGEGLLLDPFGVLIQPGNILHVVRPALEGPTLAGYKWPDASRLVDWAALSREIEAHPELFHLRGLAFGLFERAWLMRGFENFLMDLHEHPEFVEELLDGILAIHLEAIELIAKRLKVDAIFGGDDFCDQRGVIMGEKLWRRLFKPRLAKLVQRCHDLDLPMVLHSCGNLLPLVDDLMEIGLDALESLQPEAMDVFELRRRTEGRMVLVGGLGVQYMMPFGRPEEVTAHVRRLMTEMTRKGGYVLAAAKPLQRDTTTANAVALIETIMAVNKGT